MYIEPNSTIKLLHNVPLDNTYEHTVYFTNATQQVNWFNNYVKAGMTFERQSYQRHSRGYIKLEVLADNVYDCNYVMFRNTSFGTKWFYGFITNVEYVNNNVTLIEYEIDDMQTWLFDYTLKACFVEREHSVDDLIGGNLIPENFDIGEPMTINKVTFIDANDWVGYTNLVLVVAAPFDKNYNDYSGGKVTNGYTGLCYNIFTGQNMIADATNFISNAGLKRDEIVNVFYAFASLTEDTSSGTVKASEVNKVITRTPPRNFGSFDGYTPKNMKMYTYPYCYCRIRDGFGNFAEYKYEYFDEEQGFNFEITGDLSPNPSVLCIPKYYKGEEYNYSEALTLTGFPQCAWNSDAYVAWLAQTGIRLFSDVAGGIVEGGINTALGSGKGIAETIEGDLNGEVKNVLQSGLTTLANRRQIGGTQGSMIAVAASLLFIEAEQIQIRGEFARIIDDYFTKFGYPVKRVKIPTYTARPYWNYIKTIGCMAVGSVPADAMRHICSIFDKGITWWKSNAVIGDYDSQDNSPSI